MDESSTDYQFPLLETGETTLVESQQESLGLWLSFASTSLLPVSVQFRESCNI
jgi:hypothetical protein